ncbi:hypothetical protein [Streptomyces sp. Y7]|uniref:hypothetical protein n=1 Tax=Streptomyces sp. Y7 TaxID=3342392 RepID=UPI003718ADCD
MDAALQQGEIGLRAYIHRSGAGNVPHVQGCPLRCMPPDLLALGTDEEILSYRDQIRAILDDC